MWLDTQWFGPTLTTPTLTWTDAGDGTGGTAAIIGTLATATNAIYLQSFDGELGSGTWTSSGSRTGNGDIAVTADEGHYLAKVVSTLGLESVQSAVAYITVTSSTTAVQYQCLAAVQARVAALSLSGVDAGNIVVREVPVRRELALPAIVIAPQRATVAPGTNAADDYTYGVYVAIFAADNQALTTNTATYAKWIQQITRAFQHQRLAAVDGSVQCTVEPAATVPFGDWANNIYAGGVLVRCRCRESRGLT